MKISKSLNKSFFLAIVLFSFISSQVLAEEKPIDIWNLENEDSNEFVGENSDSDKNISLPESNSVYKLQESKTNESIKLDEELSSENIKIVGLYDPEDYGLSINMWSNSNGSHLKASFTNIGNFKLSKDASDIMQISLLTNAYYPDRNITEQEFISFKS